MCWQLDMVRQAFDFPAVQVVKADRCIVFVNVQYSISFFFPHPRKADAAGVDQQFSVHQFASRDVGMAETDDIGAEFFSAVVYI